MEPLQRSVGESRRMREKASGRAGAEGLHPSTDSPGEAGLATQLTPRLYRYVIPRTPRPGRDFSERSKFNNLAVAISVQLSSLRPLSYPNLRHSRLHRMIDPTHRF